MTIPFSHIPSNLRVPLFYAEVDPSRANTATQPQRTLIIGQITASGTAIPNVPIRSQSPAEAKVAGGPGSMLAAMTHAYRDNDPAGEVWYLPLADAVGSTASTGSFNFSGSVIATATLYLYIGGRLLSLVVAGGSTAAVVAAAVVTAINADADMVVTAAVNGSNTAQVDLTAKNKGAANDYDLRVNHLGAAAGQTFPPGLGVTATGGGTMSGGAGNPSLTTALANLQDMAFDFIVCPYTDTASLASIRSLLNDTTGRWSWATQTYGHAFAALRATSGEATTFGTTVNDQHLTVMAVSGSPSPAWRWAAAMAGAAAASLREDPGLPLQTVAIQSVLAPQVAQRFSLAQRNTLLYSGVSTFSVNVAGEVAIENLITTYQVNVQGQPDNSYLEVETMFLLAFVLRRMRDVVSTKYARVKLAADGTRLLPGSNVVTPSTIKADIIAAYRQLEAEGMVQLSETFAAGLVVEKDAQNPNRVNVLWPGVLINQLRIFALLAQFRLN